MEKIYAKPMLNKKIVEIIDNVRGSQVGNRHIEKICDFFNEIYAKNRN